MMIRAALFALVALVGPGCTTALFEADTEASGEVDNRLVAYMVSKGKLSPTHDMGVSSFKYRSGKDQSFAYQNDDTYEEGELATDFTDVVIGSNIGEFQRDIRDRDNARVETGYGVLGQSLEMGFGIADRVIGAYTGGLGGGGGGAGGGQQAQLAALLPLIQGARGADGSIDPALLGLLAQALAPPSEPDAVQNQALPSPEDVQAWIENAVAEALSATPPPEGDDAGDVP